MLVNNNAAAVLLGLSAVAAGQGGDCVAGRGGGDRGRVSHSLTCWNRAARRWWRWGRRTGPTPATTRRLSRKGTGALLKVHASNFKVVGFTHESEICGAGGVGAQAWRSRASRRGKRVSAGYATLRFVLRAEAAGQRRRGGGPGLLFGRQAAGRACRAGLWWGRRGWWGCWRRHPLARAFRIDKMSLAATTATLLHYVKEEALQAIPVWRMISATGEDVRERATAMGREHWRRRDGAAGAVDHRRGKPARGVVGLVGRLASPVTSVRRRCDGALAARLQRAVAAGGGPHRGWSG